MRTVVATAMFLVTCPLAMASDCASKLDEKSLDAGQVLSCMKSLETELNSLTGATVRGRDAGNALGVDFYNSSGKAKIVMVSGINTVEGAYTMRASISPDKDGEPSSWSDAAAVSFSNKNYVSTMTFVVPNHFHYKVLHDYNGTNQNEIKLVLWTETSF